MGNETLHLLDIWKILIASLLGAFLFMMFAIIYSHQIFFSNRWDSFAPRYQEIWFFLMSGGVLIPFIISRINFRSLTIFNIIVSLISSIVVIIWFTKIWSIISTDSAYTTIGYFFVDNIFLMQLSLVLLTTLFSGFVLSERQFNSKELTYGLTLGIGGLFNALVHFFGLAGVYSVFITLIIFIVTYIGLQFVVKFKKSPLIDRSDERTIQAEIKSPLDRGTAIRDLIFVGLIIGIEIIVYTYVEGKAWEGYLLLIGILFIIVEFGIIFAYTLISRLTHRGKEPMGYGHVVRATIALLSIQILLDATLLLANYYRYLIETMFWLLFAACLSFFLIQWVEDRLKSRHILTVSLILGLFLSIGLLYFGYSGWNTFLNALQDPTVLPTFTPSDVPFFGLPIIFWGGLLIGLFGSIASSSLQLYNASTYRTLRGNLGWEGNAVIWPLLLIPMTFYMGQVYFEGRIFEWNRNLLINNIKDLTLLLLLFSVVLGLFLIFGIIKLCINFWSKFRAPILNSANRKLVIDRISQKKLALFVCGIVLGSTIITVTCARFPRLEPVYRTQLAQSDNFVLWTTYPAEKVRPNYQPGNFQTVKTELSLEMVAGETERLHLIFTPHQAGEDLCINITELQHESTSEYFPSVGINWYYVTYGFDGQEEHLIPGDPFQYRGRENRTAEYFQQINHWPLIKRQNQPLWLTFTSFYNSTPGNYNGNVLITFSFPSINPDFLYQIELPLHIKILDYQKPLKYRFGTFFGSSGELGRTLWRQGRMGYHPSYPEMIPPSFVQFINWSSGEYVLNWTGFDDAFNICAQAGYTHIIDTWYPGDQNQSVGTGWELIPRYSFKWNQTVLAILADAQNHMNNTFFQLPFNQGTIKEIDMIYMELYDEPGKNDAWRIIRYGQLLDQAAPGWRLICTAGISLEAASWSNWSGPGGLYDVVDVRIQMSSGFRSYLEDPQVQALYRQYPAEIWMYDINAPWPPYPNSAQAYNPGTNVLSHVLAYYTMVSNISGYLFWTAGDKEWADGGEGYAGWGCGRYFYPTEDGSENWDPGYRFEMLDDGMEIAELLRHLDALLSGTEGNLSIEIKTVGQAIRTQFETMYHYYGDWPRPSNIEEIYIARANLINFLVIYA